jgi:hypothetical protein
MPLLVILVIILIFVSIIVFVTFVMTGLPFRFPFLSLRLPFGLHPFMLFLAFMPSPHVPMVVLSSLLIAAFQVATWRGG